MANQKTKKIEDVIKKVFIKIFPSEFKGKTFNFKKTQDKFQNWDSFSHMELVAEVENELGVSLSMDEVVSIRCPQDFVDIVKRKQK